MGNNISISKLDVTQPLGSEWVKESRQSYCAVLRNRSTGQQAEQYIVLCNGEVALEFQRYNQRFHQNLNLVSTLSVQELDRDGVSGGVHKLLVTNERIPLRLSQVSGINLQDCLCIIYSSFIGFQTIYEVQGYIGITDQMIGFTPDHRIKVWLNQNFSENHPATQQRMINKQYSISTMIQQIISIVEEHSIKSIFQEFKNYLYSKLGPTGNFANAMSIIKQYAQLKRIPVSNKVTFAGITQLTPEYKTQSASQISSPIIQTNNFSTVVLENTKPKVIQATKVNLGKAPISSPNENSVRTIVASPLTQNQTTPINLVSSTSLQTSNHLLNYPTTNKIITLPVTTLPHSGGQATYPNYIPTNIISPAYQASKVPSVIPRLNPPLVKLNQINRISHSKTNIQPINPDHSHLKHIPSVNKIQTSIKNIPSNSILSSDGNLKVQQVSHQTIKKGANLIEAQKLLQNLRGNDIQKTIPFQNLQSQRTQAGINNDTVNKTEIQNITAQQCPGQTGTQKVENMSFVSTSMSGHKIGQTLRKYGSGTQIGSNNVIPVIHTQPRQNQIIVNQNLPNDVSVSDKNILKVGTQIRANNQFIGVSDENKSSPGKVVQGLQTVIKQIDRDIPVVGSHIVQNSQIQASVSENIATQNKDYDLIQYMKVNLDSNIGTQNKQKMHSSGENIEYHKKIQDQSDNVLSAQVRDLLKSYENIGNQYKYRAPEYVPESTYKSNYNKQDPILVYNNTYSNVLSKDIATNNSDNPYKYSSYDQQKQLDDYEALKAKYETKYQKKRQRPDEDYDYAKKYQVTKTSNEAQFKTNNNLGESRFLKDYAPTIDVDDPLIVFNTKKSEIGGRDQLGYKYSSYRASRDDYEGYKSYRNKDYSNNEYANSHDTGKFKSSQDEDRQYSHKQNKPKYKSNYDYKSIYDRDNKYESKKYENNRYENNKYTTKYGSDKQSKYYTSREQALPREQKYRRQKNNQTNYKNKAKYGPIYEEDRYLEQRNATRHQHQYQHYQPEPNKYSSRRQSRQHQRKYPNQDKKSTSYHDLQALIYD